MARIFVIDDEVVIADTLSAILRNNGYDATAFYDGESALAASAKCRPDVIISDVVMPRMNGVEVAIQISRRHPDCKILLFSGNAGMSGILESAANSGYPFDVMTKPVHPKDLLAALRRVAARPPQSECAKAAWESQEA